MLLPKTRIACCLVLYVIFYMIPILLSGWIVPTDAELVFTQVDPATVAPFSSYFTNNYEYHGLPHTLLPIRLAYLLCLSFSATVVSLVKDVINHK